MKFVLKRGRDMRQTESLFDVDCLRQPSDGHRGVRKPLLPAQKRRLPHRQDCRRSVIVPEATIQPHRQARRHVLRQRAESRWRTENGGLTNDCFSLHPNQPARAAAMAMHASIALPPCLSTLNPISDASGCEQATAPFRQTTGLRRLRNCSSGSADSMVGEVNNQFELELAGKHQHTQGEAVPSNSTAVCHHRNWIGRLGRLRVPSESQDLINKIHQLDDGDIFAIVSGLHWNWNCVKKTNISKAV